LKATVATLCAVGFLPLLFFGFALLDFHSESWDPQNDSGTVQGYFFLAIAALVSILNAGVAFPLLARVLRRYKKLTLRNFLIVQAVWVVLGSFFAAFIVSWIIGSSSSKFSLMLIFICASSIFSLPFAILWFRISK
jgi:hypothetical protein